jgi:hypothetical protein
MIYDQRLSHVRHTLHYNGSTLSLRPRAAATKNKMRMAENVFIFLIGIKKLPWAPFILQIFLSSIWDWALSHEIQWFVFISYVSGAECASGDAEIFTLAFSSTYRRYSSQTCMSFEGPFADNSSTPSLRYHP